MNGSNGVLNEQFGLKWYWNLKLYSIYETRPLSDLLMSASLHQ